ncbi:DUF6894 family protein [Sphingomonas endolithica]|uniref:DUF6894 family protein n=1 Tax=Sphingomonas endolithica TaxID=2972485 RepID=UPI0021AE8F7E|nr:hypothetical protein [Sphingomonas sp. ZFBP2030]
MPRYHFHLESNSGTSGNVGDRELADDATAMHEAGKSADEVLMEELALSRPDPRAVVTVERSDGTKVAVVRANAEIEIFPAG